MRLTCPVTSFSHGKESSEVGRYVIRKPESAKRHPPRKYNVDIDERPLRRRVNLNISEGVAIPWVRELEHLASHFQCVAVFERHCRKRTLRIGGPHQKSFRLLLRDDDGVAHCDVCNPADVIPVKMAIDDVRNRFT